MRPDFRHTCVCIERPKKSSVQFAAMACLIMAVEKPQHQPRYRLHRRSKDRRLSGPTRITMMHRRPHYGSRGLTITAARKDHRVRYGLRVRCLSMWLAKSQRHAVVSVARVPSLLTNTTRPNPNNPIQTGGTEGAVVCFATTRTSRCVVCVIINNVY
jgi:hypothetical protein